MTGDRSPSRAVVVLIAVGVLVVGAAGAGLAVAPAAAGDATGTFEFGAEEYAVESGDRVEVDVLFRSDGGYSGEGVEAYAFVVAVDPEVAEMVAVEPGPWLDGDGGDVEQSTASVGEGATRITHERVGAEDGQTGYERAATITLEIDDDAPASDARIEIADHTAQLVGADFPLQTFGDSATLVLDGGGDLREPPYEPGGETGADGSAGNGTSATDGGGNGTDSDRGASDDDGVTVTTAEETGREVETGDSTAGERAGESADDGLLGFGAAATLIGVVAALIAVLVAAALVRRR